VQREVWYDRLSVEMICAYKHGFRTFACAAVVALMAGVSFSQPAVNTLPIADPNALVRAAVDNEIKASEDQNTRLMFRSTRTTARGTVTKLYVRAREGTAGIVVAYDGKPLTPEQRRDEHSRVERFVKDPEEMEKKRRQEHIDAERTLRIIRALPDAFLYEYSGEQPGSQGIGRPGEMLVALKFRPNPRYDPPSRIEQVLTGMEGVLMLDRQHHRLASIEGTLMKEVGFGWGILGHLDKGSHFLVQQQDLGDNSWFVSKTSLDVTGRLLFFKSLAFKMNEVFTDVKPIPNEVSFAQAIEMLEKEEAVLAQNPAAASVPIPSTR
jgi:hypothetical protein